MQSSRYCDMMLLSRGLKLTSVNESTRYEMLPVTQLDTLQYCHAGADHGRCPGLLIVRGATLTPEIKTPVKMFTSSPDCEKSFQQPLLSTQSQSKPQPLRASKDKTTFHSLTEAMQSCSVFSTARPLLPARQPASRSTGFVLCRAQEPKETSSGQDSYSVSSQVGLST